MREKSVAPYLPMISVERKLSTVSYACLVTNRCDENLLLGLYDLPNWSFICLTLFGFVLLCFSNMFSRL